MDRMPEVTTKEHIERTAGYQSLEPVTRPPYWGVDLDWGRRPGVPMESQEPRPMANARLNPDQQEGEPAAPLHGRPNKPMPKVFGTATPLHGMAGAIRRYAYTLPDHNPRHWLTKLFADRVESWGYHGRKYLPFIGMFGAAALLAGRSSRAKLASALEDAKEMRGHRGTPRRTAEWYGS